MEEKHDSFMAAVRKLEMLAASKVKMSGSEQNKSEQDNKTSNKQQNFWRAHTTIPL